MRRGARASAIDRTPDPALTARFAADLARLWPEGDGDARLGLAVSGGADSLALLLLAAAALPGLVEAAPVDHCLRLKSAEEARMVAQVCAELGVPHETLAVTVAPGNLLDRARTARYAALAAWCERRTLAALATGHQLDDQAETFLMRLNRGSGLSGLAGVRASGRVPDGDSLPLLRPLLGWRRSELAAIVAATGLEAARDPSNEDIAFERVRIRNALAGADWLDPGKIARSAHLLAEADLILEWVIGREYVECVEQHAGAATYWALRSGSVGSMLRADVIGTIYRGFGLRIGRAEAAAMVTALREGRKTNVAGLEAGVGEVAGERVWLFTPEHPRRTS